MQPFPAITLSQCHFLAQALAEASPSAWGMFLATEEEGKRAECSEVSHTSRPCCEAFGLTLSQRSSLRCIFAGKAFLGCSCLIAEVRRVDGAVQHVTG